MRIARIFLVLRAPGSLSLSRSHSCGDTIPFLGLQLGERLSRDADILHEIYTLLHLQASLVAITLPNHGTHPPHGRDSAFVFSTHCLRPRGGHFVHWPNDRHSSRPRHPSFDRFRAISGQNPGTCLSTCRRSCKGRVAALRQLGTARP